MEGEDDSSSDEDDDMDEDMEESGGAHQHHHHQHQGAQGPVVDADGFTLVQIKGKGRAGRK
jgi:hypothetical protein